MRNSKTLNGVEGVRLPGDGSHAAMKDRNENGIPLPKPLIESLAKVANTLNVTPLK